MYSKRAIAFKKVISLLGIGVSLGCLYMVLRILYYLSLGYRYIAYENNLFIVYFEFLMVFFGFFILCYLIYEVVLY